MITKKEVFEGDYSQFDVITLLERIAELELSRKELIEEFAEADCMGDLAKIARNYGYEEQGDV
jgi:hypothetical protein